MKSSFLRMKRNNAPLPPNTARLMKSRNPDVHKCKIQIKAADSSNLQHVIDKFTLIFIIFFIIASCGRHMCTSYPSRDFPSTTPRWLCVVGWRFRTPSLSPPTKPHRATLFNSLDRVILYSSSIGQ